MSRCVKPSPGDGNRARASKDGAFIEQSSKPRVAFYSHDTMGLGHLRRNILIASALADSPIHASTLVISGASEACYFATRAGIDCVTLPSIRKDANGNYTSRHLGWSCQQTTRLRSSIIASTLEAFSPHVFVADKVPRGIGNELDEPLQAVRQRGRTRCVLGLRDILDDPSTVLRQWEQCGAENAVRKFYDEVWIYGDPAVYDSLREYELGGCTADRAFYTGYLDQTRRLTNSESSNRIPSGDRSLVVCTVGGGQDGMRLASAFASSRLPSGWQAVLITGPYLPDADRVWLRRTLAARSDCMLVEDLVEADHYIAAADRVVSMGGYNTVASILSFGKPALVVPRIWPRREQWIRASKLASGGQLTMIEPDALSSTAISDWLEQTDVCAPRAQSIDLTGLQRIVTRIQSWRSSAGPNDPASSSEATIV